MVFEIKETIQKIISWITLPTVNRNVRTPFRHINPGAFDGSPAQDTGFWAERTDTGPTVGSHTSCFFGIGAGGINHGIWSTNMNKWMIYSNGFQTYIDQKDPFNSGNQNAGTLPFARLPALYRVQTVSSARFAVGANSTYYVDITMPADNYYTLVGCIGVSSTHGQRGHIGAFYKLNETTIRVEGAWNGSSAVNDYVVQVTGLYMRSY